MRKEIDGFCWPWETPCTPKHWEIWASEEMSEFGSIWKLKMNTYKNTTGQIAHMMEQICNEQMTTLTALCFGKKKIKAKIMQILSPEKLQNRRLSAARQLTHPPKNTHSHARNSQWNGHIASHLSLNPNNKKVPHKVGNTLQLDKSLDPQHYRRAQS